MNTEDIERRTMRHLSRRLLPFLFTLYIFNFLDRTNVSIAALQMNDELKFDPAVFGGAPRESISLDPNFFRGQ